MTLSIKRKKTKIIKIGSILIGGNNPIRIQSMTNTITEDINSTIKQIQLLEEAGCEIIRVAIPNKNSAKAIKNIKKNISIPIIADIHFDYRLAIDSVKYGADSLRINPGNIGGKKKIKELISCLKDYNVPIRIGINSGSIEKNILKKYTKPSAEGMVESATNHISILEELDFHNIKISVKSSNITETINAYRILSKKTNYPLHIGITEAGVSDYGIIKSSIGIGILLFDGIGDTLRVSLTEDPKKEITTAHNILKALSINKKGVELISCPTCARCEIDVINIAKKIETKVSNIKKNIKVAIMGCIVNGPGEAKEADIGIAGNKKKCLLYKKGKLIKEIEEKKILQYIITEIKKI